MRWPEDFIGKVIEGDCLEVMRYIPDGVLDMIWTDPPYGHGNHDGDLNAGLNELRGIEDKPIENDTAEAMREKVDGMLKQASRVLKQDCCCCCCCCCCGGGPKPTFAWVANRMDSQGLQFFHSIIWDKVNPGLGWRYRRQHEMVMVAHRTGGKLLWANADRAIPNIWRGSKPRDPDHPNEKPVALPLWFLSAHAKPGQIFLDPFCGSGSALEAAAQLGIQWIGIELDPKYCTISRKRVAAEQAQGKLF